MKQTINGFSKLSKTEKIQWLKKNFLAAHPEASGILKRYWNTNKELQQLHDEFIENTISNYYLPYAVAPNFIINDKAYAIPMAVEESSVVAAAALTAKFWKKKGGFKTEVLGTVKSGQVHFLYKGDKTDLEKYFNEVKPKLLRATDPITANMKKRGGGILSLELKDKTDALENYYQLQVRFDTKDSMGANFINSCLEAMANTFRNGSIEIVMSILSNYVPECLVRASVSCPIDELGENAETFATKFKTAVDIARAEPLRAVTHNKGIMNGIDAVVIATGNDFRAVEAGVHAFAARDGMYKGLSQCSIANGQFKFWMEIPLALGTVGGLTALHPLAKLSLQLLQRPNAEELMQIVAAAGLAQNFAALKALTTTGIQAGHMKMHLNNMLSQLGADKKEKEQVLATLKNEHVSFAVVEKALRTVRNKS